MLKRETRNFSAEVAPSIWAKLRAVGGREIESYTSAGFVMATVDVVAFFMRATARGFPSIINISELRFSNNECILGMEAWRNLGWKASDTRSRQSEANVLPRDRMRAMARELLYTKFMVDTSGDDLQNKEHNQALRRDFFSIHHSSAKNNEDNVENFLTSTERLLASIVQSNLEDFKQALADRADPNVLHPASSEPILFPLAADGRLEWVEALIATGRCDVVSVDSSGYRASYAPSVTARFFAAVGPAEIVRKFTTIVDMLHAVEAKQISTGQPTPPQI